MTAGKANAGLRLTVENLCKRFGEHKALDGVSLDVAPGELLALLGPSGAGKTTLLRTVAGLDFPDSGRIAFDAQDVTLKPAADRRTGFVFQNYALFPHLTVAKNITFGVVGRDQPDSDVRMAALLKLVELEGLGGRRPAQLSGGQQQRVALARALATEPRVLLLDEPFGALDATVRRSLRKKLRLIHDGSGLTSILVTHDQHEALELADRVAILNAGRIEQIGTPADIYERPATAFVCGFVADSNLFEGDVVAGSFTAGAFQIDVDAPDGRAIVHVRPHDLTPATPGLSMTVAHVAPRGAVAVVDGFLADGRSFTAELARREADDLMRGAMITLGVRKAHVYAAKSP